MPLSPSTVALIGANVLEVRTPVITGGISLLRYMNVAGDVAAVRWSRDGKRYTEWMELVDDELLDIKRGRSPFILQIRLTVSPGDSASEAEVANRRGVLTFPHGGDTEMEKVFNSSFLSSVITRNDPDVYAWALNVFNKVCNRSGAAAFLNRDGEAFTDFFLAVCIFYAYFVIFARKYRLIRTDKDRYLDFLRQHDFFPSSSDNIRDLRDKYKDLLGLGFKRGTVLPFEEGGEVNDVLNRGTSIPLDVTLLDNVCTGIVLGFSSPGLQEDTFNPCFNSFPVYDNPGVPLFFNRLVPLFKYFDEAASDYVYYNSASDIQESIIGGFSSMGVEFVHISSGTTQDKYILSHLYNPTVVYSGGSQGDIDTYYGGQEQDGVRVDSTASVKNRVSLKFGDIVTLTTTSTGGVNGFLYRMWYGESSPTTYNAAFWQNLITADDQPRRPAVSVPFNKHILGFDYADRTLPEFSRLIPVDARRSYILDMDFSVSGDPKGISVDAGINTYSNKEGLPVDRYSLFSFKGGKITTSFIEDDDSRYNLIPISTLEQLDAIRYDLDGNGTPTGTVDQIASYNSAFDDVIEEDVTYSGYRLTTNLDFSGSQWENPTGGTFTGTRVTGGWVPIGDNTNAFASQFTAFFSGGGYVISNLFINDGGTHVGLFGYLGLTGIIKNVRIEGGSVSGTSYVGGLLGQASGQSEVANCYTTCSVSGTGSGVGGLVGLGNGDIIKNCYATGVVSGDASGNDIGIGGLIGINQGVGTTMNCYATGAVNGGNATDVGGLVGRPLDSITIKNCYATGTVTNTSGNAGGLVGNSGFNLAIITDSYFDSSTSGITTGKVLVNGDVTGVEVKSTLELQSPTTATGIYGNWDERIWEFGERFTQSIYPTLKVDFDLDGFLNEDYIRQGALSEIVSVSNLIPISTLEQLDAMRYDLDGNGTPTGTADQIASYNTAFDDVIEEGVTYSGYRLTTNLDFAGSQWENPTGGTYAGTRVTGGWVPISTFVSTFDGNGHTISNLYISRGSSGNIGLFGIISGAVIRNLGVVAGVVTGTGIRMGILAGETNFFNRLENCYVTGSIDGGNITGGLLGINDDDGKIEGCYATATVVGNNGVGGLVGSNGSDSIMKNCYAAGAVMARMNFVGGLAGINGADSVIENCYAVSTVTGTGSSVGGLVGINAGTITASYFDTATTGIATGTGAQSTAGLQNPTSTTGIYATWVNTVWDFGTGSQYPAIKVDFNNDGGTTWQEFGRQRGELGITVKPTPLALPTNTKPSLVYSLRGLIKGADSDVDIAEIIPFKDNLIPISTLEQLDAIRYDLDGNGDPTGTVDQIASYNSAFSVGTFDSVIIKGVLYGGYQLTKNLDFLDADSYASGTTNILWTETGGSLGGWDPIWDGSIGTRFSGIFDGNGHTISNLYISRGSSRNIGLFGGVGNTIIRNLGLLDVDVTGLITVGALVGSGLFSIIENCYSTGSVESGQSSPGGLVSSQVNGKISNCYSTCSVTGATSLSGPGIQHGGGLVANNVRSTLIGCYATGAVTGSLNRVGGLIGLNNGGTITDCYATGAVTGNDRVGSLVGLNSGTVQNCYATGAVTGTSNAGGLVGVGSAGTIIASYFDITTTGIATGTGAQATSVLQGHIRNTGIYGRWNDAIWDFGTVDDYPVLAAPFLSRVPVINIRGDEKYLFPYLLITAENTEVTLELSKISITPFNERSGYAFLGLKNTINLRAENPRQYLNEARSIIKNKFLPYNSFLNENFV